MEEPSNNMEEPFEVMEQPSGNIEELFEVMEQPLKITEQAFKHSAELFEELVNSLKKSCGTS
jgi:hypothetical protein